MIKFFFTSKLAQVFICFLYTYLFYYGYQEFLYNVYRYAGFDIIQARTSNNFLIIYTFAIAILPCFLHNGIKAISSFICVFIYFILYVPVIITFFYNNDSEVSYVMWLQFLFFIGMCILFASDRFKIRRILILPGEINIFKIILVAQILAAVYIAFIYRNSLNFASYEDVYTQRSLTSNIGDDLFTGYIMAWLANVMIPMTATYGLFSKKYLYFFTSIFAALIIYMSTADKAILLFPFIILILFFSLKNISLKNIFNSVGSFLVLIMGVTLMYGFSLFAALFWMRTIGNGGLLANYYQKFFIDHPHTYYSHINIINLFSQSYPYGDKIIGQVVGSAYWSADQNANASFWATDGIAALGDYGIIFSSIILFVIFLLFNKICAPYNKLFLVCIFVPFTSSLLNQSLFSSLFTGGAFIILLCLSFKSTILNNYINENSNNSRS